MAYIKSHKHAVGRAIPQFGSVAAATLVAFASPAGAQSAGGATLKEVQVQDSLASEYKIDESANPKFTAPLVDTPQTIQIISDQLMRDQTATTLTEALRNTSGAGAFYLGENGNTSTGDAIYLRGFDTSGSIFVDGVRDVGSISRDVFNIQQIEVVKGPAGTDTGRTSPTGYINLITKKPTLTNSFLGSLTGGSASFKRGTIDWNKSLIGPDGSGAALRINVVDEDGGVPGRDSIKNKRWGFAPSLALGLNTPTRFFFDYVHIKQDNVPDGGVPTIGLPGYSTPDALGITRPVLRRTFLNDAQPVASSNFYGTSSDFDNVTSDMFTVRVEHDISPDTTVRNLTRFGKTSQDYLLTSYQLGGLTSTNGAGTVPPLPTTAFIATPNPLNPLTWTTTRNLPTNKDQENRIFINQTSVSSKFNTGSVGHTMNAGVELISEEQQAYGYFGPAATFNGRPVNNGYWPVANLYAPNPNVAGYLRVASGADSNGKTNTVGAYVFDTMKFNEQWQLTGGLRMDHYDTQYDATSLSTATTNPGLPVGTLVPTSLTTSDNLFTGKIGLVYKPADDGSVYLAYGTAAQPPGGANFALASSGNSANRIDFKPQESKTVELGTKWDLLRKRLAVTAALYRTVVSNEVVQDPTTLLYYQTGKKQVQGIELGAAGTITDNWGVSASFTTMDTSVPSGPAVTSDGSNVLAYTPKNSFTSWTTYQFTFGLTIGGGARYNGALKRGTDSAVGTPAYTDAYWVFDAMASYRVNKNFDVQFNVYNVADKDYVAAINKSGYRYTPGAPRSYRVTANFAY